MSLNRSLMSVDLGRGTRRFQRFVTLGGAKPSGGEPPRPRGILDPELLRSALPHAFRKLDPRLLIRNPVMFVVEITAALVTLIWLGGGHRPPARARDVRQRVPAPDRHLAVVHGPVRDLRRGGGRGPRSRPGGDAPPDPVRDDRPPPSRGRDARGRRLVGAAQGRRDRRRGGRGHPRRRRRHRGRRLRQRGGHHRRVRAGAQGTGHGHPQLRDGRDHARQRPPRHPRHHRPGRDLPRPHDRPRRGRQAAADAQRDRARDPARGAHDRVPDGHGDAAAVRGVRRDHRRDRRPGRPSRVPDPDHHRRPPVRHRHRRHGPRRAIQRAGDERPGRGGVRRRRRHPARQDRHDHLRQPARVVDHRRRRAWPRRTSCGRPWCPRSATRPPRAGRSWTSRGSGSPSSGCRPATATTRRSRRSSATIAEEIPFKAETRTSGVRLAGGAHRVQGGRRRDHGSRRRPGAGGGHRRGAIGSPTPGRRRSRSATTAGSWA